ncbi:hypothetical protein ON010_g17108 [Phytophthora cinnamomi]|nr:hypothetical protein ON010_g17108 [Phytophthora cinnamomi]
MATAAKKLDVFTTTSDYSKTYVFHEEDHTLGNALRYVLMRKCTCRRGAAFGPDGPAQGVDADRRRLPQGAQGLQAQEPQELDAQPKKATQERGHVQTAL